MHVRVVEADVHPYAGRIVWANAVALGNPPEKVFLERVQTRESEDVWNNLEVGDILTVECHVWAIAYFNKVLVYRSHYDKLIKE